MPPIVTRLSSCVIVWPCTITSGLFEAPRRLDCTGATAKPSMTVTPFDAPCGGGCGAIVGAGAESVPTWIEPDEYRTVLPFTVTGGPLSVRSWPETITTGALALPWAFPATGVKLKPPMAAGVPACCCCCCDCGLGVTAATLLPTKTEPAENCTVTPETTTRDPPCTTV